MIRQIKLIIFCISFGATGASMHGLSTRMISQLIPQDIGQRVRAALPMIAGMAVGVSLWHTFKINRRLGYAYRWIRNVKDRDQLATYMLASSLSYILYKDDTPQFQTALAQDLAEYGRFLRLLPESTRNYIRKKYGTYFLFNNRTVSLGDAMNLSQYEHWAIPDMHRHAIHPQAYCAVVTHDERSKYSSFPPLYLAWVHANMLKNAKALSIMDILPNGAPYYTTQYFATP